MAKILALMQCTELGGMERAALHSFVELQEHGHKVSVLSLNPVGPLANLPETKGIGFEGLPYRGPGGLLGLPAIRQAIRRAAPDAVLQVGHNVAAALALTGICVRHRLLCCHFHHDPPLWRWRIVYAQAMAIYNKITFPSAWCRDQAVSLWRPLDQSSEILQNIYELPEMVDSEERSAARASLGLAPRARVIGNAGWLIPRKRWDVFLAVLEKLQAHGETWGIAAGDGPLAEALQQEARQRGLESRLLWLGQRKDMRTVYAAMDVLLFNTDIDAMGNVPLEATALGIPAVCSVVQGGLPELMDQVPGLACLRSHDVDALTERCEALLQQGAQQRLDLCQVMRQVLQRNCNAEDHVRKLESLLGLKSP